MNLFDNPIVHADDPDSACEAAERVTGSGRRARHAEIVLGLIRSYPSRTAVELFRLARSIEQNQLGDYYEVRRRCCDLERAGLIRKDDARLCRVKGTLQVTWKVVAEVPDAYKERR